MKFIILYFAVVKIEKFLLAEKFLILPINRPLKTGTS